MPDLNITITVDGADAHVCGPDCDCPRALARTQVAIDAARVEDGREPRPLSKRLHAMRHATPEPEWFDVVSFQAQQLEDLAALQQRDTSAGTQAAEWAAAADAADASTPTQRRDMLRDAIAATARDLERAELLPFNSEHTYDPDMEISRVYAGTQVFAAEMTGALDTPAAHYVVTTSDEVDRDAATERFTTDLNEVRAWLLAWCVAAMYH